MSSYDVAIVGGGPAGTALAGALAGLRRRVIVLERSTYAEPRPGETFGAEISVALNALGAWDAMSRFLSRELPYRSVRAAWYSDELEERPSIVHPLGEGWHVDRAAFDGALAEWAEARGAIVRRGAGKCLATRVDGGFRVTSARGAVDAAYFVDASGRGAPSSARLGLRRWVACDRQIGMMARGRLASGDEADLVLEAAEDGWWYTVPQRDGGLVVAHVTDADLMPASPRATLADRFAAALARTRHTAARVGSLDAATLRIVRSDVGRVVPDRDRGVRLLGDAAMGGDPLGGNGVPRALRAAAEAAEEIHAELDGAPFLPSRLDARFADYLDRRASYYRLQTRWSDAPFWARRRPPDWRSAELTLDPDATLEWRRDLDPRALAPCEALIAPRAIAALRAALLRGPERAHVALAAARPLAAPGDRRLVIGVQALIERGAIRARATRRPLAAAGGRRA